MVFSSIRNKTLIFSNVLLLVFCICSMFFNIVNVRFHNNVFVSSSCGNNHFKYTLDGGNFKFYKNDQLVGSLSGGDGIKFSQRFIPFTCNAIVAGIAGLSPDKIKDKALGAGAATAAAVADIVLPGAACLDATLGGAGVLAGGLAATTGAVTIGSVAGPVLVAAGAGCVLG